MNFCKRSYQPILRYLYTETIKHGGEISLHKHFTEKTEVVIYGTRQNPRLEDNMSLLYGETELRRVFTYKYQGVFLDQHLSFNDHVDYLI